MKKIITLLTLMAAIQSCNPKTQPITPINPETLSDTLKSSEMAWIDSEPEDFVKMSMEFRYPSKLKYLTIHCTAMPPSNTWGPEELKEFFRVERGWNRPGYVYYVTRDGTVHSLWPSNIDNIVEFSEVTNGVKGFNHESINLSYQGGVDKYGRPMDTRTAAQKKSINNIIEIVTNAIPDIIVQGHRDFPNVNKACPSYDVQKELN